MKDERRKTNGFTIIEMLVVVSIIVILAAVVIAVGVAVKTNSQRAQTKATLKALMALYLSEQQDGNLPANPTTALIISTAQSFPKYSRAVNALPSGANSGNDGFGNPIQLTTTGPRAPYFVSGGPGNDIPGTDNIYSYDP